MGRSASDATEQRDLPFDVLIDAFEALSTAERRADIERANAYLASEEGRREFGDLLTATSSSDRV